jgi:acetylornithine deacetylase/succinyl-diaminopimelate desuccinylase-like protein
VIIRRTVALVTTTSPLRPEDTVVEITADLVRFDTTNFGKGESRGERECAEYVAERLADVGLESTLLESAPRRANVVIRIPGTDPSLDALLVHGHLDVVPAEAKDWTHDPFSGAIEDGCVWGRGTLDMKSMCASMLASARSWAQRGVQPRRDVVFAFVADEEDNGDFGAEFLAAKHAELFEGCAAGISESGGMTFHVNGTRLYPVAAAERGTMHLKLTAHGRAGHGSRPNDENPVVRLVESMQRIASYRWPIRLTPTVRAYLERTSAALGIAIDLDDVDAAVALLGDAGQLVLPTIRNSTTPTMLEAGYKVNVIPSVAYGQVDTRVLPGTEDEVLETVDSLLAPGVTREFVSRSTAVSAPIDTPWFEAMASALVAEDPEAVVVPYCMGGGTDAKAFARIGIAGYGFAPLYVPEGFPIRQLAHGVDERVPIEGITFGARVLDRFLLNV